MIDQPQGQRRFNRYIRIHKLGAVLRPRFLSPLPRLTRPKYPPPSALRY